MTQAPGDTKRQSRIEDLESKLNAHFDDLGHKYQPAPSWVAAAQKELANLKPPICASCRTVHKHWNYLVCGHRFCRKCIKKLWVPKVCPACGIKDFP